jgi:hypothetical protein
VRPRLTSDFIEHIANEDEDAQRQRVRYDLIHIRPPLERRDRATDTAVKVHHEGNEEGQ